MGTIARNQVASVSSSGSSHTAVGIVAVVNHNVRGSIRSFPLCRFFLIFATSCINSLGPVSESPENSFILEVERTMQNRKLQGESFLARMHIINLAEYPTAVWVNPHDESERTWWAAIVVPKFQQDETMPPTKVHEHVVALWGPEPK